MTIRIVKILIGCLVFYLLGWFVNNHTPTGIKVPKIVSYICGKKQPLLTLGGLVLQLIAIGFSIGGLFGAFVIQDEKSINFFALSATILVFILYFIFWGIWCITGRKY